MVSRCNLDIYDVHHSTSTHSQAQARIHQIRKPFLIGLVQIKLILGTPSHVMPSWDSDQTRQWILLIFTTKDKFFFTCDIWVDTGKYKTSSFEWFKNSLRQFFKLNYPTSLEICTWKTFLYCFYSACSARLGDKIRRRLAHETFGNNSVLILNLKGHTWNKGK